MTVGRRRGVGGWGGEGSLNGFSKITDQLQSGYVFLPPEIGKTGGCQKIVRVHHDVYEAVDEADESPVAAGHELYAPPRYYWHHRVVVQVQEADLPLFFS